MNKIIIFLRRLIKNDNESWTKSLLEIAIIISVVLIIKTYFFQLFRVSGPSMCPTINQLDGQCIRGSGEFIFVNRWTYLWESPERGDVVVFKSPRDLDTFYIKRIIGVGGDTIKVTNGKLYISNENITNHQLNESYLSDINRNNTEIHGYDTFVVPNGKFLLFGDNRRQSLDARKCFKHLNRCSIGKIDEAFIGPELISGKAEFTIWPVSLWREIENELDYLKSLELK